MIELLGRNKSMITQRFNTLQILSIHQSHEHAHTHRYIHIKISKERDFNNGINKFHLTDI